MSKEILKQTQDLLKFCRENPSALENLTKSFQSLRKDNAPHPANSPEDKAHDIVEEDESVKQALALLDTPEKKRKALEHLRSLDNPESLRDSQNQAIGQEAMVKDMWHDDGKKVKKDEISSVGRTFRSAFGKLLGTPKRDNEAHLRRVLASHPNLPPEHQARFVNDKNPIVRAAVARRPDLLPEHKAQLANDKDPNVRARLARKPAYKAEINTLKAQKPESAQSQRSVPAAGGGAFSVHGVPGKNRPLHERGVNPTVAVMSDIQDKKLGRHHEHSLAGIKARRGDIAGAKAAHREIIAEHRAMRKPNLPKSEISTGKKTKSKKWKKSEEIANDLKKSWVPKFNKT